jgi:hypothetical protein
MTTVYICGAMRGIPQLNHPAFFEAEETLLKRGHKVINPARMDQELGLDPHNSQMDSKFIEDAARRDIDAVFECDELVLLPNWEKSKGAKAEIAVAQWLSKPIRLYPSMVKMEKEDVCDVAKRLTSYDRQLDYGSPIEDFTKQARMWSVILNTNVTPQQIAMCMIAVKLCRLTNSPRHKDSVVDVVGYARCLDLCNQATSL